MTDLDDAILAQTPITLPKALYKQFKEKIKTDGFSVNDAVCSLIYNYVNDVYRK